MVIAAGALSPGTFRAEGGPFTFLFFNYDSSVCVPRASHVGIHFSKIKKRKNRRILASTDA
jgi:hypothetical protein